MITTRFSKDVPDKVAQNISVHFDSKYKSLLAELEQYREFLKRITTQDELILAKLSELAGLESSINSYNASLDSILDTVTEIIKEYQSVKVIADIKLNIEECLQLRLNEKNESTRLQIYKQLCLIRQQNIPCFVDTASEEKEKVYHHFYLAIFNYFDRLFSKTNPDAKLRALKVEALIVEFTKLDYQNIEEITEFIRKRNKHTDKKTSIEWGLIVDLFEITNLEIQKDLLCGAAQTLFEEMNKCKSLVDLNEIITNLRNKKVEDLKGYEFFLLVQFNINISSNRSFNVFKDFQLYLDMNLKLEKMVKEIEVARRELNRLRNMLPKQPQEVFLATFKDALVSAIESYQAQTIWIFNINSQSLLKAQNLLRDLEKDNLEELHKIELILSFLQRQPVRSGIGNNSLDTFILSNLFCKDLATGILGSKSLYDRENLPVLAPLLPANHANSQLTLMDDIPLYLRGDKRLNRKCDRHVIRYSAGQLLFRIKPHMKDCIEATQAYLARATN